MMFLLKIYTFKSNRKTKAAIKPVKENEFLLIDQTLKRPISTKFRGPFGGLKLMMNEPNDETLICGHLLECLLVTRKKCTNMAKTIAGFSCYRLLGSTGRT